jgi:hypothetical protein
MWNCSLHGMTWGRGIICSRVGMLVWEEMNSIALILKLAADITEVTVYCASFVGVVCLCCVTLCYVKYKKARNSVKPPDNL